MGAQRKLANQEAAHKFKRKSENPDQVIEI